MDIKEFIKDNYKQEENLMQMYIKHPEKGTNTYNCTARNLALQKSQEENLYMSMNPMRYKRGRIKRDKEHVARLKWLYVDLDTYHTNKTNQEVLLELEDDYFNKKIPTPTYIIDSGRGMYLLWKIDEHIKATPRWEKVQRYFYEMLKDYGADGSVVTDTARVLRMIGSKNSKSQKEVKVLDYYNYSYTLYEILKNYVSCNLIRTTTKKDSEKQERRSRAKIYTMNTTNSMLVARLNDLETLLLQHRDRTSSKRENILFLYRYWSLCITGDREDSKERILELNRRLRSPLSEKEVINATKSAEKYYKDNQSMKMRNATVIEFLGITEEEMKDMRTIISIQERNNRKKERNRKAYLERLKEQGKNTKEKAIKERQRAIYELLQAGKTEKEICKELNISRSTFYEDKKKLVECNFDAEKQETKIVEVREYREKNKGEMASPENSSLVLKDVVLRRARKGAMVMDSCVSLPFFRSG